MENIIITGAGGSLGTAASRVFLEAGYQIIATVSTALSTIGLPAHAHIDPYVVDLSDEEASAKFIVSIIKKYKKIDAALLLVGGFATGDIASTSGVDLRKMLTLNFETAYYTARPLFRHMLETGSGRIVLVGARPALHPDYGKSMVAYALSKSLLFNLAACLNEEAKGIDVVTTVIVPSTLDTTVNRKAMPNIDPANWVKPEDVAEIMKFVCGGTAAALRETVLKVYNNS
jgi:NAD(P)-dependent dehydrogenase (short-subunit alcohol dehydrogenase family)